MGKERGGGGGMGFGIVGEELLTFDESKPLLG